jgi:hypothetical protein
MSAIMTMFCFEDLQSFFTGNNDTKVSNNGSGVSTFCGAPKATTLRANNITCWQIAASVERSKHPSVRDGYCFLII